MLLYLLTWQDGFGNDEEVRFFREAKLDAAIVVTALGRPRVHEAVLKALHALAALAGQSAVWDGAGEV